jgi:hypothetical protein
VISLTDSSKTGCPQSISVFNIVSSITCDNIPLISTGVKVMQSAVDDALVFLDFSNIDSEQFEDDDEDTEVSDLQIDLHDTFGSHGVFGSGFWQHLVGRMKRSNERVLQKVRYFS